MAALRRTPPALQVGDVVKSCSAVFGDDMWPAADLRRVRWAINSRLGDVKLVMERRRLPEGRPTAWYCGGKVRKVDGRVGFGESRGEGGRGGGELGAAEMNWVGGSTIGGSTKVRAPRSRTARRPPVPETHPSVNPPCLAGCRTQAGVVTRERDGMQLPYTFNGSNSPEDVSTYLDLPGAGRVLQVRAGWWRIRVLDGSGSRRLGDGCGWVPSLTGTR
jgi:hypothetical protein